jgi:type I restriction enzyme M protein
VPDGVLFGSSNAHIQLRKELIDHQKLVAVISMPIGVFKPYAGVSTAILLFVKTNTGGTEKVWFYDMKADGYSLDDRRNPINDNDIPDIINRFNNQEEENKRTKFDQSFFVTKDEIVKNEYDLSINKYKGVKNDVVEYESSTVILKKIKELEEELSLSIDELVEMLGQ